jgi:hypothetical protein
MGQYTTTGSGVYFCKMINGRFPGLDLTTAKITISGETPAISVAPLTLSLKDTANSTGSISITSNIVWSVNSSETWLALTDTSGMLDDTIIVTATANPDTAPRSAIVTVSGTGATSQTVNVTQAGSPYLLVSETTLPVNAAANSTAMFDVNSNTSWSVSSSQTWLTANPTSGSNGRTITLTATANPNATTRSAIVTVSGTGVTSKTVNVTQAGTPPSEISLATAEDVTIYPCPVVDVLKVKLSQEDLPSVIGIYTLEGKQLLLMKTMASIVEIDMTKYNSGIYVLRIMTSGNTIEKKIIKQ